MVDKQNGGRKHSHVTSVSHIVAGPTLISYGQQAIGAFLHGNYGTAVVVGLGAVLVGAYLTLKFFYDEFTGHFAGAVKFK